MKKVQAQDSNYIPRNTTRNDFQTWYEYYFDELATMYQIMINGVKTVENKKKKVWYDQIEIFHKFCKLVYNTSSKYIDI